MAKRTRGEVDPQDKKKITKEGLSHAIEMFRYIKPYRGQFLLGMVFLTLSTGSTFFFITYLKNLLGPVVDQEPGWENTLQQFALILAGILILQAIFSFMRIYLMAQVSERSMADIRKAVFQRLITLGIPFFEERRVGELTSRITNDVQQLQSALSVTLAEFFRQVATFLVGFGILFWVSTELTLIMLAAFPPAIIGAMFLGRYIRKMGKRSQDALADANVVVEETLQSVHTVKAFANELFEVRRYERGLKDVVKFALQAANARGIFVVFLVLAVFGGITLTIFYGAQLIGLKELEVENFIFFIMITLFVGGSIAGLGDLYGQLQRTIGASERIRDILREPVEFVLPETPVHETAPRLQGHVVFDRVRFSYPSRPDVEVLKSVSLDVAPGSKVALVGHSGAGKSTITSLLLGFYLIKEGQLSIDGRTLADYDLPMLRANIGLVPQEVILFGGSIRENISYGRPEASEAAIEAAARKANAWDFIQGFPEGMDTLVGDRGIKLSGGQKQRVAIARAILKDPAILILDEATSSLDAESEYLVQEALNLLMEGRTTIVIAHRLSTIRRVDQIYVLDQGQIIEQGTHEELSQRAAGTYSNLLRLQLETQ
jgi:ABC-type multidrug transport system fused ATPase/permease subunit